MKRLAAGVIVAAVVSLALAGAVRAQARPPAAPPQGQAPAPSPAPPPRDQPPTEAALGVPFYPAMLFIESFDAGSGQRYFIFGATASFTEVVAYYRNVLKQRGQLVFEEPPTHMFEIGKFREETMAFPPSVTVKDFTWGGMPGYPNPKPGAEPARFQTIVQIVPIPAGAPAADR